MNKKTIFIFSIVLIIAVHSVFLFPVEKHKSSMFNSEKLVKFVFRIERYIESNYFKKETESHGIFFSHREYSQLTGTYVLGWDNRCYFPLEEKAVSINQIVCSDKTAPYREIFQQIFTGVAEKLDIKIVKDSRYVLDLAIVYVAPVFIKGKTFPGLIIEMKLTDNKTGRSLLRRCTSGKIKGLKWAMLDICINSCAFILTRGGK